MLSLDLYNSPVESHREKWPSTGKRDLAGSLEMCSWQCALGSLRADSAEQSHLHSGHDHQVGGGRGTADLYELKSNVRDSTTR